MEAIVIPKRSASQHLQHGVASVPVSLSRLFSSPFVFAYLPMFSNVIAFMDYDILNGWLGLKSPFVGFENFVKVFNDKATFLAPGLAHVLLQRRAAGHRPARPPSSSRC